MLPGLCFCNDSYEIKNKLSKKSIFHQKNRQFSQKDIAFS